MRSPRTLVIVSAATHYRWRGQVWSHTPYVRELNLWADLFTRVLIVGPAVSGPPGGDGVAFAGSNIEVVAVPPTGGETIGAKLRQLVLLPLLVWRTCATLARADAIHVRCPGNMGLLGVLLAPLFSRRLVAKYAGQWNGFANEKWTVRLQRAVLRSRWWQGPVTVYGEWPGQPDHIVPFFTSVLTDAQIADAARAVPRARRAGSLRVLFVGRLTGPKNVDTILEATANLRRGGVDAQLTVVGDGGERANLEELAARLSLGEAVEFVGAVGVDEVLDHYRRADTLVLVSESEGWPKAVAEAMTFGLACIGSDRGMVPQMLGDGRGLVVPPGAVDALTAALRQFADAPEDADAVARRAAAWASQHSLEGLQQAIADLLTDRWGVPIGTRQELVSVLHITDTLAAGGAERMSVNLINHLDRARFRAFLCTTRSDGVLASEVAPDVQRLALARATRWRDPIALWRLARFLRDEQIDIVHAHGTSLFIAAVAATLHRDTHVIWHDHSGEGAASRTRRRGLYRLATHRVEHIITVSDVLRTWATVDLGQPATAVTSIPNFVVALDRPPIPVSLPGTPGRRVVCVANLRPQKDHHMLLRATARVAVTVPDVQVIFLGAPVDAAIEQSIRDQIEARDLGDQVTLLGERPDVDDVLAGCDIGVLSSRSEGFPLALLEYGLAGLPAVATDVGDCAEILDHGGSGRLVAAGDDRAMAEAIESLLRSPDQAARLGSNLHQRVTDRYSPAAVLAEVEAVYDKVLAGPSGPSERETGPSGPSERETGPSGPSERETGPSGPSGRETGPSGPSERETGPG